jgi:hypothetical protein
MGVPAAITLKMYTVLNDGGVAAAATNHISAIRPQKRSDYLNFFTDWNEPATRPPAENWARGCPG